MRRKTLAALARRTLRPSITTVWNRDLVSRRLVLDAIAGLSMVAGLVTSTGRAFAARRRPQVDQHAERTISAVVDRMLPSGELPGALALGIDRRVAVTADVELRRRLGSAVAWLDRRARQQGALNFLRLDEPGQETVLQEALTSRAEGAGVIAGPLRNLAFTLYYTHPTIMAAFAYSGPPQPAGFPDFQDAPR
jgi:hypothetical protein